MRNNNRLKIATQKSGRLADESWALLKRCGLRFARSRDKLFCYGENMPVDVLLLRDDDIPAMLADGVCDLGIVGQNVATEYCLTAAREGNPVEFEVLQKLGFGQCRLSIAVPEHDSFASPRDLSGRRIATTYPNLVRSYFAREKIDMRIVKLTGSVEIAPSLGTADAIADLVSTGTTLRANHLREVETIFQSEAVLYQAPVAVEGEKRATLDRLLSRIAGVMQVRESKYVMLHAPKSALARIRAILPGAETPTVLSLEGDNDRVAVHAVCRENVFWEHLEELKEAGASAVLVLPVEKMLA